MSDTNTRWGVWSGIRDGWTWLTTDTNGFDSESKAQEHARRMYELHGDVSEYAVRPYPAPTPPATVEGEYRSQGCEVLLGNKAVALCVNPQVAKKVTNILNVAEPLAAENKRLREALEEAQRRFSHIGGALSYSDMTVLQAIDSCHASEKAIRTALAGGAK